MGAKEDAIDQLDALMKEFDVSATRLSLDIMSDPSFIARLKQPETKITNVALDRIKLHALRLHGQLDLDLGKGKGK